MFGSHSPLDTHRLYIPVYLTIDQLYEFINALHSDQNSMDIINSYSIANYEVFVYRHEITIFQKR